MTETLDEKEVVALDVHPIPGSFMFMSFSPPPVAEEIHKQFAINVTSTIFTFADVIHNPAHAEIPDDFIKHEEIHAAQHGHTPEGAGRWWARYFQDPLFRIDQEAKAFAAQYDWWCKNDRKRGGDRNWRSKKLTDLAYRLAAPTYGNVVNVDGARGLIKRFSKTK